MKEKSERPFSHLCHLRNPWSKNLRELRASVAKIDPNIFIRRSLTQNTFWVATVRDRPILQPPW